MSEAEVVIAGALMAATAVAAVEYYRQVRRARKEYEKARDAVDDIVLSFNRQIKQEADKLGLVAYKVEAASSRSDNAFKEAEEAKKTLLSLEGKVGVVLENQEKASVKMDEVDKRSRDAVASQEVLANRISSIEEQTRQLSIVPEARVEAVIPIRREKALAPLTETELSVLEMLSSEGPKTAPNIKNRIRLSREHTARLMKRLYEEGYLERDANKIPFKYSVKKEMEKLLKKPESQAT